jgi:NAD(P)-dependent dehydrogenase (short-subunit alcohol dehydrogenase family)
MLLEGKKAVICGGSGAVVGAAAPAFAREGARVLLAGRPLGKLEQVAGEISDAGGAAEAAEIDIALNVAGGSRDSPDGDERYLETSDRMGDGPAVILVCGGSVDRTADARIAEELASDFTVFNYDRRGRGDSSDTPPYAIEREVEDIDAVVEEAGGAANLWGSSSRAVLALIAAESGRSITKLALWEPPFIPEGYPVHPTIRWRSMNRWWPRAGEATRPSTS